MKKNSLSYSCVLLLLFSMVACDKESTPSKDDVLVVQATGNIGDELDTFRQLLGDQLNTTPVAIGGRREINWDGVPDSLVGKDLPLDFFNPTAPGSPQSLQRGLAYSAAGQFRVSNDNFREVNSNAAGQFQSFSGNKTFANISSNAWEIVIEKPGSRVAAAAKGFGVVFSDVDLPNSTSLEFFDGTKSIGRFFAPPHDTSSSFSFLGVYFNNGEHISRVRIAHDGNLAGGEKDVSDNGPNDLVILDDLLYSEPVVN